MVRDQKDGNGPCAMRCAVVEESSDDLACVIQWRWAFGNFTWNQGQHAGGEHTPRKSLPFRSVEHIEDRMGDGGRPS